MPYEVYDHGEAHSLATGMRHHGAEVARLLVADEVFSGVLISPEALDPRPFLETLDRWGVRLRFRREVETDRFL